MGTFLSCNKKVPRLPGRDPAFQLRGKAQQSALAIRQTIQNYCWIPAFAGMTEAWFDGLTMNGSNPPRTVGHRIPGNIPFIPRIIFAIPPLENCFIIFCVCSN